MKGRTFSGVGVDPDSPAVFFDDGRTNGETNSATGTVFLVGAGDEHVEDAFLLPWCDARPIVADREMVVVILASALHLDSGRTVAVSYGIGQ